MKCLEKTYLSFLIIMMIIFFVSALPTLGFLYLAPYVFIPTVFLASFNFSVASANQFKTSLSDFLIMILSIVTVIPFVGGLSASFAVLLCIFNLINYFS